jgi:pimeloyl-ACP methyl ester carboxylesterase
VPGGVIVARQHLVIVVPGIGGSVLEQSGTVLWDAGLGSVARLGLAGHRLSLAETPAVEPTGLIRSRALVPGWTVVCGYDRLIAALARLPSAIVDDGHPDRRVPDANVVAFPYDFRTSIVDTAERLAAEVTARLAVLGGSGEPGRVIVVAHSMGGLVARYWIGPLGGWRVCRALVTLGTPHRGAPKALNWLVGGVRIGGHTWRGPTQLFREWPSVTELLPRYPAVWDATAEAALYPHELPVDWLRPAARKAFGVHEDIETAWEQVPPSGPEFVPRIGWSHTTMDAAWWDGTQLIVRKKAPSWLSAPGWEKDRGDGTVPAISALPVGLENWAVSVTGIRVLQRHSRLPYAREMIAEICARIQDYEGRPRPVPGQLAYREAEEHTAAIDLDVDEMYAPGEPIPLRMRLREVGADVRSVAVAAVLRLVSGPVSQGDIAAAAPVRLVWDDAFGCFAGEVTPADAGMYDLAVTAEAVPGVGDLAVTESVAVVEP